MRTRNEAARALALDLLRRTPGISARELAGATGLSQPTISRFLAEHASLVASAGRGPRRRYYLRRTLRGRSGTLPVHVINAAGQALPAGTLDLIAPEGSVMDPSALGWPVDPEFVDGVWPGLPCYLQDLRPQGFLGRSFAEHIAAELQVPARPQDWSDEDVAHVLSLRGYDTPGNLVVGEGALQRWLDHKAAPFEPVADRLLAGHYCDRAEDARRLGAHGSSAAGEFPKFTALRSLRGSATPHVIVKFSARAASGPVRRWKDLLVCEHLALQHVTALGLRASRSRILDAGERRFLEVERFDRHGPYGRSPLCSLGTLDAAMLASSSPAWPDAIAHMRRRGWLGEPEERCVRRLWFFGQLIGNSDMHSGNLSLVPAAGRFDLAPAYDMLPMMYAPLPGGELPASPYAPTLPQPAQRADWMVACTAALAFWHDAAHDSRISEAFRRVCRKNHVHLDQLADKA